jgi:hypothetical protein
MVLAMELEGNGDRGPAAGAERRLSDGPVGWNGNHKMRGRPRRIKLREAAERVRPRASNPLAARSASPAFGTAPGHTASAGRDETLTLFCGVVPLSFRLARPEGTPALVERTTSGWLAALFAWAVGLLCLGFALGVSVGLVHGRYTLAALGYLYAAILRVTARRILR